MNNNNACPPIYGLTLSLGINISFYLRISKQGRYHKKNKDDKSGIVNRVEEGLDEGEGRQRKTHAHRHAFLYSFLAQSKLSKLSEIKFEF